jgi:hypothetical protein
MQQAEAEGQTSANAGAHRKGALDEVKVAALAPHVVGAHTLQSKPRTELDLGNEWNTEDVRAWLIQTGFRQYVSSFKKVRDMRRDTASLSDLTAPH